MTEAGKVGVVHDADAVSPQGVRQLEGVSVPHRDPSSAARLPPTRGLSEQTQLRLGNHLRAMYDSVLQQPVPDRFRDLIERLDSGKPGDR